MNALTFGTKASYEASLVAHNAKYGTAYTAEQGRMILEAQRKLTQDAAVMIRTAPASDKAVEYMVVLWLERSDKATAEQVRAWGQQQTRETVSAKIDWLKAQPKLARLLGAYPDVPAGRYAVTGDEGHTVFVKVDRPTEGQYKGRTFVAIQAGDDLHKAFGVTSLGLLRKIVADGPKAASIRYGRELGECGRCGRTLTDEASRAAGIGPVCASKSW